MGKIWLEEVAEDLQKIFLIMKKIGRL